MIFVYYRERNLGEGENDKWIRSRYGTKMIDGSYMDQRGRREDPSLRCMFRVPIALSGRLA